MSQQSKKLIFIGIGFFFVAVGTIGIFLPLLPTTPFLLISLWAFSRSSDRFHDWLYHHRFFGPFLQDWNRYGTIPLKAKLLSIVMMVISGAWVIFGTDSGWIGITSMLVLMGIGAGFILSRPHKKPGE
jgi:uncharacterized protein